VVDNFQTTLEFYENAVKNGHVDAMLRLAYIYEKGIRIPKNFDKAVEYYKSAAEHGSAEAKLKLARIGIEPQNYGGVSSFSRSDACKMLKELSEESKVNNLIKRDALYFLGQLYEQGIEKDSPDFNAAFECFSKSSNLGSLPSMYKYGCYLFNGQGCVADKVEAFAILHIVRFISSSNVDPSVKSQELISPDQLVELTERRLVDYEDQLTEAQRSEAFKIADERLGRIFNVS
jgi:TPR repeat protein